MTLKANRVLFTSLLFFMWTSFSLCASAHKEDEFVIYYRFDRTDVDTSYLDNRKTLAHIRYYLQHTSQVDSITIYAWASPEGGYRHNKWLSERRAESACELLISLGGKKSNLDPSKIVVRPSAENWPGLTLMVEQQYFRSNRDALLKILHAKGISEETRKWRIQHLDNGATWKYLKRNYMKRLRAATWICVWSDALLPLPLTELGDTLVSKNPTIYRPLHEGKQSSGNDIFVVLKTDVLLPILSGGTEVSIGQHLSLGAYYLLPWLTWGPNNNKYAFQIQELAFEGRYYPFGGGDRRLSGWFAGLYARSGQYDLQNDTKFCYQGEYWSAGATAGYVFSLKHNLRLELGLDLGYLSSDYRHYQPDAEYEHLYRDPYKAGRYSFFGPTGVKLSLSLPIFIHVKN